MQPQEGGDAVAVKPPAPTLNPENIERVRARVAAELDVGVPIATLADPNRPDTLRPFALIGVTPQAPANRSLWHRCSFCETDRKFRKGRIILGCDMALRMIGDECWKDDYGDEEWKEAKEDLRGYELRKRFDALRSQLLPALNTITETLRSMSTEHGESLARISNLGAEIRGKMPHLYEPLSEAKRRSGALTIEEVVENPAYELNRRSSPFVTVMRASHRPQGLEILDMPALKPMVWSAVDLLARVPSLVAGLEGGKLSNRQFASRMRELVAICRNGLEKIRYMRALGLGCFSFFDTHHLIALCRWANDSNCILQLEDLTFEHQPFTLRQIDRRGNVVELTWPRTLVPSAFPDVGPTLLTLSSLE